MNETIKKFYEMTIPERLDYLHRHAGVSVEQLRAFSAEGGLSLERANGMIENVIGLYSLPVGVAQNFRVNGRDVLVPMAVEEPSIVAGASYMAKLALAGGGFEAQADNPVMIGQMQLLDVPDRAAAVKKLQQYKAELLAKAASFDPLLVSLGGGPRDLQIREIAESPISAYLVLHWHVDVRDAMGANAVNTIVERMAPDVEQLTGGRVHLRILTNLADQRLARARVSIPLDALAFEGFGAVQVRDGILEAWAFAASDPYRAATHNKGIMNGIDAVLLTTANDWRAVEAGAHAYAARNGRYTSLSTWGAAADGSLTGSLELPMAVGTFGGATHVHPGAKAALALMGVKSSRELAEVIVSVGLAQNLAALRALSTEGIQRGHMGLHARQIALSAGAVGADVEKLAEQLVTEKNIRIDRAKEILKNWGK